MARTWPWLVLSVFCALLAWALAPQGLAQEAGNTFTETILSLEAKNDALLEIDAGRSAITAEARVRFRRNGPAASAAYRVDFHLLLGDTGQIVPMGPAPGTLTISSPMQTVVSAAPQPLDEIRDFSVQLRPTEPLLHTQRYRLRAYVQLLNPATQAVLNTETSVVQDPSQTYYHFTSIEPGDAPWNILGHAEAFEPDKTRNQIWQVNQPSRNQFFGSLQVTLRRADAWDRPAADVAALTVDTRVRARLKLTNITTAQEIPLTDWSGGEQTFSVAPFVPENGAVPRQPATVNGFVHYSFAPQALDTISPLYRYRLEATLEHTDDTPGTVVIDNTVVYDDMRLAVLSGKLFFGDVAANLTLLDPALISFGTTANPDGEIASLLHLLPLSASLAEAPTRTFPAAPVLNLIVLWRPNGDLRLTFGTVPVAGADSARQQGVRVNRGPITLTPAGATLSQITIHLPAGLGYAFEAENGRLRATHTAANIALNGRLEPSAPVAIQNPGGALYLVHERLPHRVRVSRIEWQAGTGRFLAPTQGSNTATTYVRETELAALESVRAELTVPTEADRPSNEKYLRRAWAARSAAGGENVIAVRADAGGKALLDAGLVIPEVDCEAHFPQGVRIRTGLGQINIRDSVVDPAGSLLTGAQGVEVRHSPGQICEGVFGRNAPLFTPDNNVWGFTPDGGLHARGSIPAWNMDFGLTHDLKAVHSLRQVTAGSFHIPGHVLNGGALAEELPEGSASVHRPAALLLTGYGSPENAARLERPLTPAYAEGLADYAGFNVRAASGLAAISHIAGEELGPYTLKPHSKYCFRPAGASGVHDAVSSEILPLPKFYGYDITLDGLRLAYLDNVNAGSAIGGAITLPHPSAFGVALAEIKIDVYGELLGAKVVNPGQKTLAYWGTPFTPTSAEFAQPLGPGGCPVGGTAFFSLNVKAALPAVTDAPLYGRLGFKPNGTLVARADAPGSGLDSRLVLPSSIAITTPGGGRYTFMPVTGAALNSYETLGRPQQGFVSMAGMLDVPFFQDIKVHLHASASGGATGDSPLYVMGGWSNDPAREARDHFGWDVEENGKRKNFFNDENFDPTNRGWPAEVQLVEDYRDKKDGGQLSKQYRPVVRKVWRGVVDLDYSVEWDRARRTFTGFGNPETNVLILQAHHELRTLSTTGCSITFGAELSTPRLNVSDLAAERLVSGAQRSISRALDGVFNLPAAAIAEGIDGLEKVVNDRLAALLDGALAQTLDEAGGVTDKIYTNLRNFYIGESGGVGSPGRLAALNADGSDLNVGGGLNLRDRITALAAPSSPALEAIKQSLNGALSVCDSALDVVSPGRRDKVRQAVQQLAAFGGVSPGDMANLNQAMADAESSLKESEAFLRRVRGTISDLLAQLNGGPLASSLQTALANAADSAEAQALRKVRDHFASQRDVTGRYFNELSEAQLKARISLLLRESLCSGALAAQVQPVLRARFNDLRERFRSGLDLVFGSFNRVLIAAVKGAVTAGVNEFAELAGAAAGHDPATATGVGDFFAAARLDGYAQISGEKIQEIRINASLQMKVSDALVVDGWFRLLNCDSNTPNTSCREQGLVATEVTVGAHGKATFGILPVEVTAEGKFSFDNNSNLVGLDGSFDLQTKLMIRQASLDRVAFKFGFGGGEGYLSGRVGATVDFVQMEGFCFFGTTKNARALDLLDPETRDLVNFGALGQAGDDGCLPRAVTGFYQGFEGAVSINAFFRIPDTCFLRLQGLIGSGNFCFLQGPSNDPRLIAGVRYSYGIRGEILCLVDITGKIGVAIAASIPVGSLVNEPLNPNAFVGALQDAEVSGTGSLRLSGKVGPCPFCVKFSKTFTLLVKLSRQGGVDVGFE